MYNESLSEVLKKGFSMTDNEIFDTLSNYEQVAYQFCNAEIKTVFRAQTNQQLLRKFNEMFKKDD